MTEERVKEIISKIQYKPNFKIEVQDPEDTFNMDLIVHVSMQVLDAYYPGRNTTVVQRLDFEYYEISHLSESEIIQRIQYAIESLEMHEMNEWLKYDGVRVREPHPEFKKKSLTELGEVIRVSSNKRTQ